MGSMAPGPPLVFPASMRESNPVGGTAPAADEACTDREGSCCYCSADSARVPAAFNTVSSSRDSVESGWGW